MRRITRTQCLTALLMCLTAPTTPAAIDVLAGERFGSRHMTCQAPVALTRDCSIRQGPTRPVAVAGFRMNVAGDAEGRTILIGRVRKGPDHNARLFTRTDKPHAIGIAAIRALRSMLRAEGLCLERWQPGTRGRGALVT